MRVLTVREILAFGVEERMGARVDLEDLAANTLTYKLAQGAYLQQAGHTIVLEASTVQSDELMAPCCVHLCQ